MTSQENPLWRFKSSVREVYRIVGDVMVPTEINRARFTVIAQCVNPMTEEQQTVCEFYSNALDGDKFILGQSFIEKWDALIERA